MSLEQGLREAEKCMYCGFCEPLCPTLPYSPHRGHGPRGRVAIVYMLLNGQNTTEEAVNALYTCTLCGACMVKCPAGIDIVSLVRLGRSLVIGESL